MVAKPQKIIFCALLAGVACVPCVDKNGFQDLGATRCQRFSLNILGYMDLEKSLLKTDLSSEPVNALSLCLSFSVWVISQVIVCYS